MKILSLSLVAMARSMDIDDIDTVVSELEADAVDMTQYHDFQNTTFDVDYRELAEEYFQGGLSQLVNGNGNGPRGRSRAAGGPVAQRTAKEDKEFVQRFLQLKYSILFLQRNKKFGRYCFYGCWCLPNGSSDLGFGTGPPIDDIDRSCREFATCYNCLYNTEIGRGCDEDKPGRYTIKGRMDPVTKQKYLMCMDPPGSCKRMRCECDKNLAEKLQEYESQWNIQNHRRWGSPPFEQEKYCTITHPVDNDDGVAPFSGGSFASDDAGSVGGVADEGGRMSGPPGESSKSSASSTSPNRAVASAPIYGEIVGCCGRAPNLHYFRKGQKCCSDGEVVDANAPCDIDFL